MTLLLGGWFGGLIEVRKLESAAEGRQLALVQPGQQCDEVVALPGEMDFDLACVGVALAPFDQTRFFAARDECRCARAS